MINHPYPYGTLVEVGDKNPPRRCLVLRGSEGYYDLNDNLCSEPYENCKAIKFPPGTFVNKGKKWWKSVSVHRMMSGV